MKKLILLAALTSTSAFAAYTNQEANVRGTLPTEMTNICGVEFSGNGEYKIASLNKFDKNDSNAVVKLTAYNTTSDSIDVTVSTMMGNKLSPFVETKLGVGNTEAEAMDTVSTKATSTVVKPSDDVERAYHITVGGELNIEDYKLPSNVDKAVIHTVTVTCN